MKGAGASPGQGMLWAQIQPWLGQRTGGPFLDGRSQVSRLCYLRLSLKPIQAPQTMCLMSKGFFYFRPLKGLLAKQPSDRACSRN